MTPGLISVFRRLCRRSNESSSNQTPIRIKSVTFEPDNSQDSQDPSHFRFQESDLDDFSTQSIKNRELPHLPSNVGEGFPNRSLVKSGIGGELDQKAIVYKPDRTEDNNYALSILGESSGDLNRTYAQVHESETPNFAMKSRIVKSYAKRSIEDGERFNWLENISEDGNESAKEEIQLLRNMVQKLNTELSRFQRKEISLKREDRGFLDDIRINKPWLLDLSRFVPLLVSYEEEVFEKNEIVREYEKELARFRKDLDSVSKENSELLCRMEEMSHLNGIDLDQHIFLRDNARLVLEENELLKEKEYNHLRKTAYADEAAEKKIHSIRKELLEVKDELKTINQIEEDGRHRNESLEEENRRLKEELKRKEDESQYNETLKEFKDCLIRERKEFSDQFYQDEKDIQTLGERLKKMEFQKGQLDIESKVLKKMVKKYEDLVLELRSKLLNLSHDLKALKLEYTASDTINKRLRSEIKVIKADCERKDSEIQKLNDSRNEDLRSVARLHKKLSELKMFTGKKVENLEASIVKNKGERKNLKDACLFEIRELRTILRDRDETIKKLKSENSSLKNNQNR